MINGMHALIYSPDPDADRAFLRDTLGWSFVEDHPGWLIFLLPLGDLLEGLFAVSYIATGVVRRADRAFYYLERAAHED